MLLNNEKCPNCGTYYDPTLEECPTCHKTNELYTNKKIPSNVMFFHPLVQIGLFLCGFAYAGMLLIQLIMLVPASFIEDPIFKRTIILFSAYLVMLGGLVAIAIINKRRFTFLKKFTRYEDYLFAIVYAIGIVVAGIVVSLIISAFHEAGPNSNQDTAVSIATNYPILSFFIFVIFGPICEELTYRVGLYSFLRRINKYLAFVVTVIVFAFIHFDFAASDMINELTSLPSYLISGLLLTIAYEHRGPACSITTHMVYNLFAFIMMFLG